jgi:hypothetical protein
MSNSSEAVVSALPQLAGPSQVAGRWRPLGALEPGRGAELERAREQVLGARSWFAEPEHERRTAVDVRSVLADRIGELRADLDRYGVASVDLGGPVSDLDLIAFASEFGTPAVEDDPHVQPYVSANVVLDIRPLTAGADAATEPFSPRPLKLHVEGTRRPAAGRFRYLVFEYREVTGPDRGGQTVLLPMSELVADLGAALDTGRRIALHSVDSGPIVSDVDGRTVINYRDPGADPVQAFTDAEHLTGVDVAEFLRFLTRSLYAPERIRGVHPVPHRLLVLDNTRFLHGRTEQASPGPRRLRRIRVLPRSAR